MTSRVLLRQNLLKFPERVNSRDRFGRYDDFMQIAGHQTRVEREKEGMRRSVVSVFFLAEK